MSGDIGLSKDGRRMISKAMTREAAGNETIHQILKCRRKTIEMAEVHNKIFARGRTGAVGDPFVIHKTKSGRTIIANQPMFAENREFSEIFSSRTGRRSPVLFYTGGSILKQGLTYLTGLGHTSI